jgi:type II secretory pathway component PulF
MSMTGTMPTVQSALAISPPATWRRWWASRRLTLQHRVEIYRYLARELRLGTQLIDAVSGLFWIYSDEGRRVRHPIAVATRSWLPRLRTRDPVVEVLRDWLPPDELPLVAALEQAKDASELIGRLEHAARFRGEMQSQILKVASYPAIITLLLAMMMRVVHDRVYLVLFDAFHPELSGWQGIAMAVVEFVARHGTALGLALMLATLLVTASMSRLYGPVRAVLDNVFPWSIYRVYAGTSFLDAFAMLLSAGMQPLDAIAELQRSASPYLKWRLALVRRELRSGASAGDAFVRAGRWPSPAITYTLKAARANALAGVIAMAVRDWREQLVRQTEQRGQVLYGGFFVVAGLLLFGVFASVFGVSAGAVSQFQGI